jgi:hypothetical protein
MGLAIWIDAVTRSAAATGYDWRMTTTTRSTDGHVETAVHLTLSEPLDPLAWAWSGPTPQTRSISHAWDGGALASARDAPVMIGGDVVQMARDLARGAE